MDDELVLLTSYFNLANGRRQDTADTFRVDPSLPSRTSPDGTAALYIVTESSVGGHMGPRARRLAADTVAWEYSSHGDEPPASRLKAALRTAHDEVLREFDGHVSVGVSIIAVEHKDIYLAQVAPSQVYVLHEGSLHSISATAAGSSPFAEALGASGGPRISVFRDEIESGDVLAVCSSWFNRTADPEDLRECFGAGSADDIAESLLDLGRMHDVRDASVIVIEVALASELEAGAADGDEPPGFQEQVDIAVQALANVGRMLWDELRPVAADDMHNGRAHGAEPEDIWPDRGYPPGTSGASPVPRGSAYPGTGSPLGPPLGAGRGAVVDESTDEFPHLGTIPDRDAWHPGAGPEDTGAYPTSGGATSREQATEEFPVVGSEPSWQPSEDAPSPAGRGPDRQPTGSMGSVDTGYPPGAGSSGSTPAATGATDAESAVQWHSEGTRLGTPHPESHPGATRSRGVPAPPSELDEVNSRIQNDPDLGDVIPPVQTFPDMASTEPSRIYATSRDIQAVNRRPRRFGGIARPGTEASGAAPVLRPGLGDVDLRKPVSRPAPPWVVWLAAAAVGIFAIVAAYKILHRSHAPAAFVNTYPAAARHDIALALKAANPAVQDGYLNKAKQDITLAKRYGDTKADLHQLHLLWQNAHDTLYKITREPAPIVIARNFFQSPSELAISPDTLYVLDPAKKGVFAVKMNSSSPPTQVVQNGEIDSGITIGSVQHITTSVETALALDDQSHLIRVANGTKTAVVLPAPSSQGEKIVAMANFGSDVFLLDATGSQIWRYSNAVTSDQSVPTGFLGSNAADIGQPVSFTLDDKDLWVLKANGQVLEFDTTQGNQQPFKSTSALRVPLKGANAIFTDVGLPYVWIADPGNNRIVQLDKNGNYVRSYMAPKSTGMDLSQLKGLAVPTTDKTLYVLTAGGLFSFPVTP